MEMGSEQAFQGDSTSNETATPGDDWASCARSAMAVVTSSLTRAPLDKAFAAIEDLRSELDSLESVLLAKRSEAGHSDRSNENVFTRTGKVSKGEAKRRTKRANAVRKNPKLAKGLADGDISTEQVDNIAEASDKTDGAAANDEELIDEIANANPDQGKKIAKRYIEEHQDQNDRDDRYRRQRKLRKVEKTRTVNGLSRLIIDGDDETIDSMYRRFQRSADGLYRTDGGRDVPNDKHRRTYDQRMFDAAADLILGGDAADPEDDDSEATGTSDGQASRRTNKVASPRPPGKRPGERPTTVLRVDIDNLAKRDNLDADVVAAWKTDLVGTGLVPTSLAEYFECISDFAVQLVSGEGAVLWHGRSRRLVSVDQWISLVARDGGCAQCGAHHTRCEAHHLIPWTAPLAGTTDIDNMALMCVSCHHQLHDLNLTLYQDPNGRWKTRKASVAETPARPPQRRHKRPRTPTSEGFALRQRRAAERSPNRPRATTGQGQRAP